MTTKIMKALANEAIKKGIIESVNAVSRRVGVHQKTAWQSAKSLVRDGYLAKAEVAGMQTHFLVPTEKLKDAAAKRIAPIGYSARTRFDSKGAY